MKLAYVYGTGDTRGPVLGAKGDPAHVFPFIKGSGYAAIEPFVRDPNLIDTVHFEKMVNRFGLEVAAVGTGPVVSDDQLTFTDEKSEVRREAVHRVKEIVDFASLFNAPVNIGKLRGNIDEARQDLSWNWMEESFLEICEYADQRGITIILEPQNTKNINNINTTKEGLSFIDKMNLSNLYLMLDVYHMSYEDESISLGLVKAKNRLLHLHFADSNRRAPGQGKFNFEDIMKTLHSIQYNGYLSMEVSYEIDRYEEAKETVDYLSPWMKEE